MNIDDKRRFKKLIKQSRTGHYVPCEDNDDFIRSMREKYPVDTHRLEVDAWNETMPFGAVSGWKCYKK